MAKPEDIVDVLSSMTVLEALQLAKALEAAWGVRGLPVAGRARAAPPVYEEEDSRWFDRFEVILRDGGPRPAEVIALVRELTGLRERDARHVVEGAPKVVMGSRTSQQAEAMKTQLEAAGAKVEVK